MFKEFTDRGIQVPNAITTEHLRVTAPAWPLQNTVAVNPFWNQIDQPFEQTMARMSLLGHRLFFLPASYYLEKYQKREIRDQDIEIAHRRRNPSLVWDASRLERFITNSAGPAPTPLACESVSDFVDRCEGSNWSATLIYETAKYASAYFDESQALAKFPWRGLGFYEAWFCAQEFDRSFEESGMENFRQWVKPFRELAPELAMQKIAARFGLTQESELALYLGRLCMLNNGWASQFRYHEWRQPLGYPVRAEVRSLDLVAVQMIIDYAAAEISESRRPGTIDRWRESFRSAVAQHLGGSAAVDTLLLWQSALEIARQRELMGQIKPREEVSRPPQIQVAMCIDVRSEPYRRALESASTDLETIGFAGFFGLPFEYKKVDEASAGARGPVLLRPAFTVQEETVAEAPTRRVATTLAFSYFRNLRKAPLSSFLFVELFGAPALWKLATHTLRGLRGKKQTTVPEKFVAAASRPGREFFTSHAQATLPLSTKVKTAASVLTHMGIRHRLGRLVVLAGHGSYNTNNAFASASDCGACGGHSGDVNAHVLANLLNDPEVRAGLREQGIDLPSSTWFLPALHETVTDELYLLGEGQAPASHQEEIAQLKAAIKRAGEAARRERQGARSSRMDASPWRRARNWSEVRPEWALAGNSCFIVAPRRFTKHANFEGRSFLHDYDWRRDEGFATLELILTAPMLVTNWINMQYYASTVAPEIYGAGNKVLHNLVNEVGVVEGNGGDLRIGLPWQSVHDGEKFVHEPVRLSVFLAAPVAEIERILRKHPTVRNLVDNEWLFLFHVDDESGAIRRREKGGHYQGA